MQKSLSVLLVATLALSACSSWRNSRANPSNWFGPPPPPAEATAPNDADALIPAQRGGTGLLSRPEETDTSVPIAVIDELRINPTPTGAIIYATGTAIRQGAYNARLVPVVSSENREDGVLEFSFRVNYPRYATQQGPERSRMVSDAVNVSDQDLQNVRLVRVIGQQNKLESRRR